MRARRKDQPRKVERPDSDFYPTKPEAVWPLLDVEAFGAPVWECACGNGAIARILRSVGIPVIATDLNGFGYGYPGINFLQATHLLAPDVVTNPPYKKKLPDLFVRKAISLGARRIMLLLPLTRLEGVGRTDVIEQSGLARVHVFRERLTMYPEGEEETGSGVMAMAWFVWERGYRGKPEINRISAMRDAA